VIDEQRRIFSARFVQMLFVQRACVERFGFHVNETIVSLFVWNVINAREKRVRGAAGDAHQPRLISGRRIVKLPCGENFDCELLREVSGAWVD
jgi:hypothetical protein